MPRLFAPVLLLATLLGLAACNTMEGFGEDMSQLGSGIYRSEDGGAPRQFQQSASRRVRPRPQEGVGPRCTPGSGLHGFPLTSDSPSDHPWARPSPPA